MHIQFILLKFLNCVCYLIKIKYYFYITQYDSDTYTRMYANPIFMSIFEDWADKYSRLTKYIWTPTPMNTCTQSLLLWASLQSQQILEINEVTICVSLSKEMSPTNESTTPLNFRRFIFMEGQIHDDMLPRLLLSPDCMLFLKKIKLI